MITEMKQDSGPITEKEECPAARLKTKTSRMAGVVVSPTQDR